jgi:hypothetical protein
VHVQPTSGYGGFQGTEFAAGHEGEAGEGAAPRQQQQQQQHVAGDSDNEARSVRGEKRQQGKEGDAAEPQAKRQQSSKAGSPVR